MLGFFFLEKALDGHYTVRCIKVIKQFPYALINLQFSLEMQDLGFGQLRALKIMPSHKLLQ
jgi:hypothetical protein